MLLQRLQRRCKSARVDCVASLPGYRLTFSKLSRDGSGKATLVSDAESRVFGVVFDIDQIDVAELDRIEGRGQGYERIAELAALTHPDVKPIAVTAYIAQDGYYDPALQPFDWYRDLVLAGAAQNNLPETYQTALRAIKAVSDPDLERRTGVEARAILAGLGLLR
jgi:hypothetical protein